MSSVPLPFGSNPIQVYAYEGFDYTIVNSVGSSVSNTAGLDPQTLYFTTDTSGNVRFTVSGTASTLVPSANNETFTLSSNGFTSVNTVTVNGGRFLDSNSNTLSNNSYTFYRNETISPIQLVAPFNVNTPTSIPALPPGLSFVRDTSSVFNISGTPLVVVPNSNYQIIGVQSNGSKVVTTRFNMAVSNERLQMNLPGSSSISGMQIGTAITPRVITSVPPVGSYTVRYTFPVFPDGIYVQDICGNTYSNITSFTPSLTDPSYTMIIAGTPTLKAAESFRDSGFTDNKGRTYTIQGSRTIPLPIIENKIDISFAFQETILFDTPVILNNYTGIPIVSNSNYFGARTYFTASNAPITNIFSPDLASVDPSLTLVFDVSRAYLTGTTSVPGTKNFTVRAVNGTPNSTDLLASVTISNDIVSFSSPVGVDLCYNFILSRPLTQIKPGYYESSNIQFVATAASGRSITLSAPALTGTGLSLDSNGTLSGIPSAITPLTNLVVTASTGTTSATETVKFAILNDVITLGAVPSSNFNFVQNIPITSFQIPIQSTLSGRNVIDYSETNLPNGLSINPAGVISGTCLSSDTSGTITISATTGFASGSNTYDFSNEPDTILFTVPQDSYAYLAGQAIDPFYVTGVAYSGTPVSNFISTLPVSYGLTMSSDGIVSGTWTDSLPPNQVLPSSCNFAFTAVAGGVSGELPVTLTASPVIQKSSFVWGSGHLYRYDDASWSYVSNVTPEDSAFDIQIRNNNVDGNFVFFTARDKVWKATNTAVFTSNTITDPLSNQLVSSLAFKPGSRRLWVSGTRNIGGVQKSVVARSDDNNTTWNTYSVLESGRMMLSRDGGVANSNSTSGSSNPYLNAGIALKYSPDAKVLMAGGLYDEADGPVMLRSSNDGSSWDLVNGEFSKECAYLSLDVSGMWVATGSGLYRTLSNDVPYNSDAITIKYSTDSGSNWSNATNGFTLFGYELVYASNTWVATGVNRLSFSSFEFGIKYSSNGFEWSNVDIFGGANPYSNVTNPNVIAAPLPIGSIQYDGSNWNVLVQRQSGSDWLTETYSASDITSPTWTVTDVSGSFPEIPNDSTRRFVGWTRPVYLRTSQSKQIGIDMTFSTGIGNGPTITSPSTSAFLLYQYVPMSLVLSATGTNYFFIRADELPPGLRFNPLTKTISGKPASQGFYRTRVFAKDDNGVTLLTLNFTVNTPRVIRKQDGAGAYTSLLRQYTEVLGAQNARDNRVLPSQERRLGEFMSPEAPNVVTQPFSTLKCGLCGRVDCPTVNQVVETGDATLAVCDFIDANAGDIIDLGDAQPDVCD